MIEGFDRSASYSTDPDEMTRMNKEVIKLINHKTLPLNKERYQHLQKIIMAKKQHSPSHRTQPLGTEHYEQSPEGTQHLILSPRVSQTSRSRLQHSPTVDSLLNRLKGVKELSNNSALMSQDKEAQDRWENLRKVMQSPHTSRPVTPQAKVKEPKPHPPLKVLQPLYNTIEKAEVHLRKQKKALRQKHCRLEQQTDRYHQSRPTQLEKVLRKFQGRSNSQKKSWYKFVNHQQLEKQLLVDMRQNLLQTNFNRIKRSINHKKIVQMKK